VEVAKEGGYMGEHQVRCCVLDALYTFDCRGRESSQERVAVVKASDDERLDQDLYCFTCEEGPEIRPQR